MKCTFCGERAKPHDETWQQWQCACCASWNEKAPERLQRSRAGSSGIRAAGTKQKTADRFRHDNTEGYSDKDLRALNTAYGASLLFMGANADNQDDPVMKSACDCMAERVLAEFDATKDR